VDRRLLLRALQLGFSEIEIPSADAPLACKEAQRVFVFMPLSATAALPPDPSVLRVTSTQDQPMALPPPERRKAPMPAPQSNAHSNENNGKSAAPAIGIAELIAEGEALRDLLHEAAGRTARLVAALKQQRRHSQAVRAAMASLRQLQIDP
jgi:hypothetical protein